MAMLAEQGYDMMEEMENLKKDVKGSFVELSKAVGGALEEVCNELKGHVEASLLKLSAKIDCLKVDIIAEKPSSIPQNDTIKDTQKNKEDGKGNKKDEQRKNEKPYTSSSQPPSCPSSSTPSSPPS